MTPETIRSKFILKYGSSKYIEFVLSLYEAFPFRSRLFYWQEQLMESLFAELSVITPTVQEVYSIFSHCPIHNIQLKTDIIPVVNGNVLYTDSDLQKKNKENPLANTIAPRNLDHFVYPTEIEVWFCSECRLNIGK